MENPNPLLRRCQALVLFSEYEGTPVTIDEAKVLGVPVIANDVGGVKSMLGMQDTLVKSEEDCIAALSETIKNYHG